MLEVNALYSGFLCFLRTHFPKSVVFRYTLERRGGSNSIRIKLSDNALAWGRFRSVSESYIQPQSRELPAVANAGPSRPLGNGHEKDDLPPQVRAVARWSHAVPDVK